MNKYKLRDLLTIHNGKDYRKLNNGKIPVYGTGGLMTYVDDFLYEGESILLPRKGTLDNIMYVSGRFWTVDTMYWTIVNSKKVYPKYLYYYLSLLDLSAKNTGSALPSMTYDSYYDLDIELPEINYQIKLADYISNLDSKIANNNAISKELESMAKTIYDYWFLQFEFPDKDGKPYKSNGGKMVWNDQLKQEIPEGWKVNSLDTLIKSVKNGAWGKEQKNEKYSQQINCIRGADFPELISSNNLNAPKRYITEKDEKKLLENGDLIIEISGGSPTQSTGRIAYINSITLQRFNNPITTSNFCKALTLKNIDYQYWLYLTWNRLYKNNIFFNYEGKTTGIKNLMFNNFIANNFIIPEKNTVHKFQVEIEKMFNKIQYNALENQQLQSLRNFLLPMLMNGQVTIKD